MAIYFKGPLYAMALIISFNLPTPPWYSIDCNMKSEFRERQKKSNTMFRVVYNISMGILVLAMAVVMLVGESFGSEALNEFIVPLDPLLRYLFGGLCLIYGAFRLYRGIKKEY